jgi:hypothetical protein
MILIKRERRGRIFCTGTATNKMLEAVKRKRAEQLDRLATQYPFLSESA